MGGQKGKGGGKKGTNPGVGIDFKKAKHKVGKKLPKAQNETDTTIKAKAISLPNQGITEDKDGIAVNHQNHTLKELLGQSSHYAEKTRKHALEGIKDLFTRHPEELRAHVGIFYTGVVPRISDSDAAVRTALQTLLRECVVPTLDGAVLQPFMPVIMAHVCAAMTHLSLDVRNDALVFLDILMDHCPSLVMGGFLAPCLQHFSGLLSSSNRGRSIKASSIKALLKVLKALCGFLRRAYPPQQSAAAAAAASASTASHVSRAHTTLFSDRCAPVPRFAAVTDHLEDSLGPSAANGAVTGSSQAGSGGTGSSGEGGADTPAALARKLVGQLSDAWAECNPATLPTAPEADQVQALNAILTAITSLVRNLVLPGASARTQQQTQQQARAAQSQVVQAAEAVLKRLAPAFPATMPAVKPAPAVLEGLIQYNLSCCQLLVCFLPLHVQLRGQMEAEAAAAAAAGPAQPGSRAQGLKAAVTNSLVAQSDWVDGLVAYYMGVLQKGVLLPAVTMLAERTTIDAPPGSGGDGGAATPGSAASMPTSTASVAYKGVLQGVEAAARVVPPAQAADLLSATAQFAARLPSRAANRAQCLALQHGLVKAWQRGEVWLDAQQVGGWLGSLPKLLWELGSSAPDTSALCLRMLHDAARYSSAGGVPAAAHGGALSPPSPLADALSQLQPQLAPLFSVKLPARPTKRARTEVPDTKPAPPNSMPGVLSKLPEPQQQLAVDMLYHLGALDRTLLRAVVTAAQEGQLSHAVALRAVEVLVLRLPELDPAVAGSALLTLIFPPAPLLAPAPGGDVPGAHADRLLDQVELVLRMVESYAPAGAVLLLLGQQLQALLTHPSTPAAALHLHSVLRLYTMHATALQAAPTHVSPGPPEWLSQALPQLCAQLCLYSAAGGGITSSVGVAKVAQGTVLDLVSTQPQLGPPVLQALTAQVQRDVLSAQPGAAQAARQQYVAAAQLAQGLLCLQPAKPHLLAAQATVQGAVKPLIAAQQLPSHISADPACAAELTRVQHAALDLYGAL